MPISDLVDVQSGMPADRRKFFSAEVVNCSFQIILKSYDRVAVFITPTPLDRKVQVQGFNDMINHVKSQQIKNILESTNNVTNNNLI